VSVAKRAHAYPQVTLAAAELVDTAVVTAPAGITAADGARLARKREAGVVACGDTYALREDLARAVALGLGDVPARSLTRALPVVARHAPELDVRRRLAEGATVVVVTDGRTVVGAVARAPRPRALSLAPHLARTVERADLELLGTAGRLAEAVGARAFVAGGIVRDAWRAHAAAAHDLDVVVEGDGPAVARALASELHGTLVEHERFLTASVTTPSGIRLDVVTARSERYESPGALPRVMPATIEQDLRRRDFAVNAMAATLGGEWPLLDPLGGIPDLARRRLRVLHPLSFVEDPTRLLRGARYAARLDFNLDAWTVQCQALAVELAPYPALSGHRLAAELERVIADARPAVALARLGRAGVFRIVDPRYRFTRRTASALTAFDETLAWTAAHGLPVPAFPLALVALVADQPRAVATAFLERLALRGEPLARVMHALDEGEGPGRSSRARGEMGGRSTAPHSSTIGGRTTGNPRITTGRTTGSARITTGRTMGNPRPPTPLELAARYLTGDTSVRARVTAEVTALRREKGELRGDELIELGVPRGPAVGTVLDGIRAGRRRGEITDRAAEIDYVRSWVSERHTDDEREG
jgi:tRNA nucleotidyltransferase (CCA-adding enzyme)